MDRVKVTNAYKDSLDWHQKQRKNIFYIPWVAMYLAGKLYP